MGIGGEYGEGALLIRGSTVEYYNTISASIGFQLGAQARSVIIVFMTPEALAGFRRVDGWKVGVDGSVALITVGVGGSIDTNRIARPIVGFIFDGKGLMYNLTLEGQKSAGSGPDKQIGLTQSSRDNDTPGPGREPPTGRLPLSVTGRDSALAGLPT
jgi:lipid-binding SYLF domain-containing protein